MHEFLICINGAISIEENRGKHILRQGSAIFIPSNIAHQIEHVEQQSEYSEVLLACVKPITLDLMRSPLNGAFIDALKKEVIATHSDDYSEDPMRTCVAEACSFSKTHSLLNQSLEENCFLKMLLLHAERLNRESISLNKRFDIIDDITAWIKKNFTEDIHLDDLSERFLISRSQMTRKFKQQYGFSLIEFVLQLRFETAAKHLALSSRDITSIALDAGFNNLSYFHRQFKRRFGMTPLTFRNMTAQSV